ncbi:hypothetical protein D3C84_1189580 [compost metagenome]
MPNAATSRGPAMARQGTLELRMFPAIASTIGTDPIITGGITGPAAKTAVVIRKK